MIQYCTQCGAENDNDARFCKSCRLPLTRQTETRKQNAERVEQPVEPIVSNAQQIPLVEPMKSSMLWIFPGIWIIYHFIFVMHGLLMPFELMPETIASSFGSGFAILLMPLLVTGIIRLVKKANDTPYPNFVKHTFTGTIIMFFLAIAGNINTKMEQSVIDSIPPAPQDTLQESYEDAAPAAEAAEYISPEKQRQIDEEYAREQSEYDAQYKSEQAKIAVMPSSEIIGTSSNMNAEECEQRLQGNWLWDGNKNRWICHKIGARNGNPQTKVASENSMNDTNNISLTKSAAEYADQAYNLMNKNPKKAIDLLNQAIKINPTEGWYYNNRAVAYLMLQNPKKAMQDYNKAISISKNAGWIYENRGYAYWQLGNLQKAKADAKKACSLGDCKLSKEISKWERENARLAEEHAPAADAAPLAEEVQGTINE